MSETAIVFSNLSFSWPGETPLFEELSFTVGDGHTGLVAPNGAGKSTLLKLITGEYRPSSGSVTVDGSVGYLPQTLAFEAGRSVADVLGVAPVLDALDALAAGDAGDAVFAAIGDEWDIEERTRAQLDRLGLAHIAIDRTLGSLSGGEVVSVGLAASCSSGPMCCCSTNRPTTSTPRPAPSSTTCSTTTRVRCCWSATTACFWIGWTASPNCTEAK